MCFARRRLLSALLVALVLAIAAWLRVGVTLESRVLSPLRADAVDYFAYAYNLRHHGIYSSVKETVGRTDVQPVPDARRRPGYPLFLTLFVDGPPTTAMLRNIALAQTVLGVLTVAMAWAACRRWMPAVPSLVAALLVAMSPHLVNSGLYVLSESLFAFLLAALIWACSTWLPSGRTAGAFGIGALIGMAAMVRPSLAAFWVPMAVLAWWHFRGRGGLRLALLLAAGFLLVSAPWTARNLSVLGTTGSDRVLLGTMLAGIYPNFTYGDDPATFGYPYRADPRAEEFMHDAGALSGEIARRFREEPGPHLRWFLVGKPIALWSWNIVQGQGGPFVYEVALSPYYRPGAVAASAYLMRVTHWPLVLLGLAGALLVWLPSASRSLAPATLIGGRAASLLLLYFLLLHMVLAPYPRYSVPLRPTLYGLAMLAAWVAFDALRTRLRARPATATGPVPGRGDQCLRITRR